MAGDHPQHPPPPYSQLPHERNNPNDNIISIQIDVPNERSPLLPSPPSTVQRYKSIATFTLAPYLPMIIIPCALFIMTFLYDQLALYGRDSERYKAGVAWSSPIKGTCVQYASRSHSATLHNYVTDEYWVEACERTQMIIHGTRMKSPLRCELVDNEVIGHWDADDGGCRPFFSIVENEQCSGSDKVISARLKYIENDTQWENVCMTTPFHTGGKTHFPNSCQNKGVDGIWGYIQIIQDKECMKEERVRRRHEAGVFWDTPQPLGCEKSGVGGYSTVLLNYSPDEYWEEACETTELVFNGETLMHPDTCKIVDEKRYPIIAASWSISGVSECTPFWGSISKDHCVGTNKRMMSARLWGIKDSHLWNIMCATTSLTLQNIPQLPSSCENKGLFGGIWGHWEIDDNSCNMFRE